MRSRAWGVEYATRALGVVFLLLANFGYAGASCARRTLFLLAAVLVFITIARSITTNRMMPLPAGVRRLIATLRSRR